MEEKKHDLVLLFSGGIDSTLLLLMALKAGYSPYCLIIDYGQSNIKEVMCARDTCCRLQVTWRIITIEMPTKSNLTKEQKTYEGVSEWYVPSRNLIFLGLAASLAESEGIDTIWYGANYEDKELKFLDCYPEWIEKMNELLAVNGSVSIKVEAPLLGMDKRIINHLATLHAVDMYETSSGYETENKDQTEIPLA